jgi:hypothetical protein
MKYNFLILPFSILYLSITSILTKCPVKRCERGTLLNANTCIKYHVEPLTQIEAYEIVEKQCNTTTQYCPNDRLNSKQDTECEPIPVPGRETDGSPCTRDKNCGSGQCDKNVNKCMGIKLHQKCSGHKECEIGLYCDTHLQQCTLQNGVGKDCHDFDECKNNLGCYEGKCVNLFALKDGRKVNFNEGLLCESNYVWDKQCASTELWSDDECTAQQTECNYSFNNITSSGKASTNFTRPCFCSAGEAFKTYCRLPSKGKEFAELIAKLKDWYNGDAMKKHTLLRNIYPDNLHWAILSTQQYPEYKNSDKCVKDLFDKNSLFLYVQFSVMMILCLIFA